MNKLLEQAVANLRELPREQNALALVAQPLHHGSERRFLLVVRADPAQPNAERDQNR